MDTQTSETKQFITLPVAIIIVGVLIAGAVIYSGQGGFPQKQAVIDPGQSGNVRAIDEHDHIRGNPDAPVKIVEYSDFECIFCKKFHTTMEQVMNEYGTKGKVAWVYRHYPIEQLHPTKAHIEALASECVNELKGNDAFWSFADMFFSLTPSNNETDIEHVIPQITHSLGINIDDFNACMQSGTHEERIKNDIANARETGGDGTPWSIVIAPNGKTFPISGAQSYATVKGVIDIALKEKK